MIVLAIMGIMAGITTQVVFPELRKARVRSAALGADQVRQAAKMHREIDLGGDGQACPSVGELVSAKKLDGKRVKDPWGTRYEVRCESDEVRGRSAGGDRRLDTADDVHDDTAGAEVERIAGM
jgi:general secretion pathway protein G